MAAQAVEIRLAEEGERRPLAVLFAAVAEERDGIASEPPIDVEKRPASWRLDGTLVALEDGEIVEEGRRTKHIRRASGELWDLIDMGLLL